MVGDPDGLQDLAIELFLEVTAHTPFTPLDWSLTLTQVQIEEKGPGDGGLSISSMFDRFLTSEEPVAEEGEPAGQAAKKQKKRNDNRTKMISVIVSLASIESISTIRYIAHTTTTAQLVTTVLP